MSRRSIWSSLLPTLGQIALVIFLTSAESACLSAIAQTTDSAEFKQAKAGLQTRLRNRASERRIEALRELGQFQDLSAAKLIHQSAVKDPDDDVRTAARRALQEFRDNAEVCEYFATLVAKDTRKKSASDGTLALAEVLLYCDDEKLRTAAVEYLDRTVLPSRQGSVMLLGLAEELYERDGLAGLKKLTTSSVFEKSFPLRRTIVQMIAESRQPSAVPSLIELLPKVRGEVRADVIKYLVGITGQRLGADVDAWREWWKANEAIFEFPAQITKVAIADTAGSQSRYYGLPLYGERLVFIIDTSGSMQGGKLEAAKRELIDALFSLPDESYFSLVTFSTGVNVWQREMVPATLVNKKRARAYVMGQRPGGFTASYPALQSGLQFDAEAIYFLSDGEPTTGRIVAPPLILQAIGQENRSRRMSIYTIGIATGGRGSVFDTFMETLASENAGAFRAVE
jgi:hypothetical protein